MRQILFVDDEQMILDGLRRMLRDWCVFLLEPRCALTVVEGLDRDVLVDLLAGYIHVKDPRYTIPPTLDNYYQ